MSFLDIIAIFLIFGILKMLVSLFSKMRRGGTELWNGPKPTRREQKKNKEAIFRLIEQFPDGILARNNPQYVDEYLNSIELDLPPGVTTSSNVTK
jgi:hypothetical protein